MPCLFFVYKLSKNCHDQIRMNLPIYCQYVRRCFIEKTKAQSCSRPSRSPPPPRWTGRPRRCPCWGRKGLGGQASWWVGYEDEEPTFLGHCCLTEHEPLWSLHQSPQSLARSSQGCCCYWCKSRRSRWRHPWWWKPRCYHYPECRRCHTQSLSPWVEERMKDGSGEL